MRRENGAFTRIEGQPRRCFLSRRERPLPVQLWRVGVEALGHLVENNAQDRGVGALGEGREIQQLRKEKRQFRKARPQTIEGLIPLACVGGSFARKGRFWEQLRGQLVGHSLGIECVGRNSLLRAQGEALQSRRARDNEAVWFQWRGSFQETHF